jgi:hypothetical protein
MTRTFLAHPSAGKNQIPFKPLFPVLFPGRLFESLRDRVNYFPVLRIMQIGTQKTLFRQYGVGFLKLGSVVIAGGG